MTLNQTLAQRLLSVPSHTMRYQAESYPCKASPSRIHGQMSSHPHTYTTSLVHGLPRWQANPISYRYCAHPIPFILLLAYPPWLIPLLLQPPTPTSTHTLPHLEPLLPTLLLLEQLDTKSSDRHHVPTWRIYVTGCHDIRIPLIFGIRFALSHAENHPPGTRQIHVRCLGAHSSIA